MTEPAVKVFREASIGWIVLNRPEARNPLNPESAALMRDGFHAHSADPKVRSIVITGAGDAFCAGGDLRQMSSFATMPVADAFAWPRAIVDLQEASLQARKPLIAAVNGPAFAGGMGLAGLCDIVLATPRARFALPEVKVGIFPMIIVAQLSRSIPRKRLLEMMFTGEPMDAETAERVGFVNRVYPDQDALMQGVRTYASTFEKVNPDAIALGRRTFNILAELPPDRALDAAQFFVLPFHLGEGMAEGASAFLERREPSWLPAPEDRVG